MDAEWSGKDQPGTGLEFDIERDLICTADSRGYFTSLNACWERTLGWTREELMSRPFSDFVHPADRERTIREASRVCLPDYHVVEFENRYRARGGGWRWLRWSARADGETWVAVAIDVTERREAERQLAGALAEGRLLAYSQPILDQRRGAFVQEELLARLREQGAEGSVLEPREFLPDAERHGAIIMIDRWMAARGIAIANRGRRAEVNLSARSLGDGELAAELVERLHRPGARPDNLIFEVTETAAVEHLDAAREFAERLTGIGCQFALDDFGTGFGSLTHLRRLPVRYLKIDRSFVSELPSSREDRAIVKGIVAIARELGVLTVAEGIEDDATLALLRELGVDYAQGYAIGRPAPLSL